MIPDAGGGVRSAVELSIVVPVYRNADTLVELSQRLRSTLTARVEPFELVLVNDACPEGSERVIEQLMREQPWVSLVALASNRGQQQAILHGLRSAGGRFVAVLDADLQDPPEALFELYQTLQDGDCAAVFATRVGTYQSASRMLTSRIFKWLLSRLTGLPRGAGCYVMMTRAVKDTLLESASNAFYLPMAIAKTGFSTCSVPVARAPRPRGSSSYSEWGRARVASKYLRHLLLPGKDRRVVVREERTPRPETPRMDAHNTGMDAHNTVQREYYELRTEQQNWRMRPRQSLYIDNHVAKLIDFGELRASERILDAGCGMGKYTLPLARKGFQMAALDLSPVLLERLREATDPGLEITTHCADLHALPDELAGRFDVVVGFFMLHHLFDVALALRQIRRLLARGGRVVFLDVNPLCPLYYLQISLSPSMSWKAEKGLLGLTQKKLRASLLHAGFDGIRMARFGILPPGLRNRFFGRAAEETFDKLRFLETVSAFQLISAVKA